MAKKLPRMAVCRIVLDAMPFDHEQPYNRNSDSKTSTGTGFFLRDLTDTDGCPIMLTAYHCCANAVRIRVLAEAHSSSYIGASLIGANPKMDIALLRVEGLTPELGKKVFELERGDSDRCYMAQRIQAIGFALGKTWNQSTVGVISGRTYTHLQVDAAINGGNSGGPVLDDMGKVIGIVLAGMDKAQNVNYLCPINETLQTAARILGSKDARPICIHNADMNCRCVPAPKTLLQMLGSGPGILVTAVYKDTPLYDVGMRPGDVLCSLAGHDIDFQGRIEVPWWVDRLPIYALLARLPTDEPLDLRFWSRQRGGMVETRAPLIAGTRALFDRQYPDFEHVPHVCHGGLIVQPLSKNLLSSHKSLAVLMTRPELSEGSILVISSICPESPFTELHTVASGDVVLTVNETPVRSLEQYCRAFDQGIANGGVRVVVRDGNEVAATSDELATAHRAMQTRIPTMRLNACEQAGAA